MYGFFDFYTKIPKKYAMHNFGVSHIVTMFLIFLLITFSLIYLKKLSKHKQQIIIKVCAILVPILELSHNIWLYFCGNATISQLLSLHLCGLQMYFIPLAIFTNIIIFKDFVFATSILGGLLAIIFPSGITDTYPLWHFQTLQTFIYHSLLVFVPIALIITTDYRPTIKRFYKIIAIFLLIVSVAWFVDITYDQNYLFLVTAPDMFFLHNMQIELGTAPYLIFTFFFLLTCSILIHLPFDIYQSLKEKQKE